MIYTMSINSINQYKMTQRIQPVKYNLEFITKFCSENHIILLNDLKENDENDKPKNKTGPKPRGINRDTIIEGKCAIDGCENLFKKPFRALVEKNGYCRKHGVEYANKKREETCLSMHGCTHVTQSSDIRNKTKKTCLEKYGKECPLQSKEVKDKAIKTNLKNLGVENPSQSKDVILKKRQKSLSNGNAVYTMSHLHSLLKDYNANTEVEYNDLTLRRETEIKFTCGCGDECVKIFRTIEKNGAFCDKCQNIHANAKSIETNMTNRGVPYNMQDPSVVEKVKSTNFERWGGHPMQNPEIVDKCFKNSHKYKNYLFPSGRIDKIQGYEHFALDELLQNGMSEECIVTGCKNVPPILWYDDKGKEHTYFVDIFIPSQNLCIEVKSTYTVESWDVLIKHKAVKDSGYLSEIWIYNEKKEKVNTIV